MRIFARTEDGIVRTASITVVFLLTHLTDYRVIGTRLIPRWKISGTVGYRKVWLLAYEAYPV